ncbi:MAG: protein translocase subunit SecF [Actinobacteria bacterium]|nr:protein translocase subunit SecF [Actinomycetota bacterium]
MSVWSDLYRERTDFNFPRLWPRTAVVSIVLMVIAAVSLVVIPIYCSTSGSCERPALNLSIDFEGGSVWEVPSSEFDESGAEEVLAAYGPDAGEKFQRVTTGDGTEVLRISGRVDQVSTAAEIATKLADAAGVPTGDVTVSTVGPSWGSDITRQARTSLIVFLVLVALYIAWRLETRMAIAALAAVLHDVVLTAGVYSVFQIQVTPATVIAFLTILGFSLYDTIVVYDRVQENAARYSRSGRYTYTAIMRRSLNQVFMRSLNTTLVTVIPIAVMYVVGSQVFGQQTLGDFSLALLIGLVSGTYSSIFVAAPLTVWLKEREPRWKDLRARLAARGDDPSDTAWYGIRSGTERVSNRPLASARAGTASPRGQTAGGGSERNDESDGISSDDAAATVDRPSPVIPPRPRKKRR